jgi:hypothetical protein
LWTPLCESTPAGRTSRIAPLTFSGGSPPGKNNRSISQFYQSRHVRGQAFVLRYADISTYAIFVSTFFVDYKVAKRIPTMLPYCAPTQDLE